MGAISYAIELEKTFLVRYGLDVEILGQPVHKKLPKNAEALTLAALEDYLSGVDEKVGIEVLGNPRPRRNMLLRNIITHYGKDRLKKKVGLIRKQGEKLGIKRARKQFEGERTKPATTTELAEIFIRELQPLKELGLNGIYDRFRGDIGEQTQWSEVSPSTLLSVIADSLVDVLSKRQGFSAPSQQLTCSTVNRLRAQGEGSSHFAGQVG